YINNTQYTVVWVPPNYTLVVYSEEGTYYVYNDGSDGNPIEYPYKVAYIKPGTYEVEFYPPSIVLKEVKPTHRVTGRVTYIYTKKVNPLTIAPPPTVIISDPVANTVGGLFSLAILIAIGVAMARAEYETSLSLIIASALLLVVGILLRNQGVINVSAVALAVLIAYRVARRLRS
ncbi:MAG: hypothetical protein DRJ40_11660, partial [Thermoprotei archaeon]